MIWWVFHEGQLDEALALREADTVNHGATEQQARDDTFTIKQFLVSEHARKLIGGRS